MTRGEWYAQRHGGGWRKARKPRQCDQITKMGRCPTRTPAGEQYFDTNAPNHNHPSGRATIGLCAGCANEQLN